MEQENTQTQKIVLGKTRVWKRILAFLIDLFIVNSFLLIPFKRLFDSFGQQENINNLYYFVSSSPEFQKFMTTVALFAAIVAFLYFALFEAVLNQTIGKMLFNIYVIPAAANEVELKQRGVRMGFFIACIRNLFIFPFFPFILLWVVDFVTMFLNPLQQRFSEMITGTRTVERYIK